MTENSKNNWWKWGDPAKSFHLSEYQKLKTYLEEAWSVSLSEQELTVSLNEQLPESKFGREQFEKLFQELEADQFSDEDIERAKHGMGRSYHDLIKLFTSSKLHPPDFILYPKSQDEVRYILDIANTQEINIVTFSGGSNVTGALDIEVGNRPVCALNMGRLNRLIELDELSLTATFEGGIFGPELEDILNKKGYTLGHFPQSFEYSTLGGWAATRSAGQESGLYGKIEDMILGIKAISPTGTIENLDFPRHAAGIDVHNLFIGSEGTLGVIVQVKVQIHKQLSGNKWVVGIFKNYESGLEVLRRMVQSGIHPTITRFSDPAETKMLSLFSKEEDQGLKKLIKNVMKAYIKSKGYTEPAIMMCMIPESSGVSKEIEGLITKGGGFVLPGKSAGAWEDNRFSLPYLRDTLVGHKVLIDTFETVTYWDNLKPLYEGIKKAVADKCDYFEKGGMLFCHVSHIYHTGASLYFSLLAKQEEGREIEQWEQLKGIVSEAIVEYGGAISHHHGIGKDHQKWYLEQLSDDSRALLGAVKKHLDPKKILNPGKLYDK